jgi:hypothetical protein
MRETDQSGRRPRSTSGSKVFEEAARRPIIATSSRAIQATTDARRFTTSCVMFAAADGRKSTASCVLITARNTVVITASGAEGSAGDSRANAASSVEGASNYCRPTVSYRVCLSTHDAAVRCVAVEGANDDIVRPISWPYPAVFVVSHDEIAEAIDVRLCAPAAGTNVDVAPLEHHVIPNLVHARKFRVGARQLALQCRQSRLKRSRIRYDRRADNRVRIKIYRPHSLSNWALHDLCMRAPKGGEDGSHRERDEQKSFHGLPLLLRSVSVSDAHSYLREPTTALAEADPAGLPEGLSTVVGRPVNLKLRITVDVYSSEVSKSGISAEALRILSSSRHRD